MSREQRDALDASGSSAVARRLDVTARTVWRSSSPEGFEELSRGGGRSCPEFVEYVLAGPVRGNHAVLVVNGVRDSHLETMGTFAEGIA